MGSLPNDKSQSFLAMIKEADHETATLIGHFVISFARCEYGLTCALANLVDARDSGAFELVARGMDARVKCERLRRALNAYAATGPNFDRELSFFENKVIPLRNELVHTAVLPTHTTGRPTKFMTIADIDARNMKRIDRAWTEAVTEWLSIWYFDLALFGAKRQAEKGIFETSGRNPPPQRASS